TANNLTIDATGQAIILDGTSAGNTEGLVLSGNDCTVRGLSILNFEAAGVLVEGAGNRIDNDFIGIDSQGNPGPDGKGVYLFQADGASLVGDDIENNTQDAIQVFQSAGVEMNGNVMEGNAGDGIRVLGQMANSGQPFVTRILFNQIDLNEANGVHLV